MRGKTRAVIFDAMDNPIYDVLGFKEEEKMALNDVLQVFCRQNPDGIVDQ